MATKLNHKQNVEAAGYEGKTAAYLTRKLNDRNVTDYDNIPALFGAKLAGVSTYELASKLKDAAKKPAKSKVTVAKTADKTAVEDK